MMKDLQEELVQNNFLKQEEKTVTDLHAVNGNLEESYKMAHLSLSLIQSTLKNKENENKGITLSSKIL